MKFNVILCDPPWRFKNFSMTERAVRGEKWGRANGRPIYDTMDTEDIASIDIQSIAAKDCVLFMWATFPKLEDSLYVIKQWGFTYKTVAFTWVKTNPSGKGWHFGLGYWTRGNPEICLLATKGKPKRVDTCVENLLIAPRGRHSAKPPETRDRITQLMGSNVSKIELFAREEHPDWYCAGLDVDGLDINDSLKIIAGWEDE